MKKQRFKKLGYFHFLAILPLMALGLSACTAPSGNSDYTATHKNIVGQETLSMEMTGDISQELKRAVFNYMTREFHLRANGPMAIEIQRSGQTEMKVLGDIEAIKKALVDAGIRTYQIVVLPTTPESHLSAVVSFTANTVEAPECDDWSTGSSYNWSNTSQANFGCATQRNLGLMVADPGDLNSGQTMTTMPSHIGIVVRRLDDGPVDAAADDGGNGGGGE